MQINFSVTVPAGVVFTFTPNQSMPAYFNGQAYPPTSIGTANGGFGAPYTFAPAALPSGMALSAGGVLSGTPVGQTGPLVIAGTVSDAQG
jgi:hypothetical protein